MGRDPVPPPPSGYPSISNHRHTLLRLGQSGCQCDACLDPARWSAFDALVGHVRRYDPDDLLAILGEHSFVLEQSAAFGMEPRSRWLLDFAVWGLTQRRVQAMRWYNRLLLPLGLRLQKRLACAPGLIDVAKVDELLVVCRRGDRRRKTS